MAEKLADKLKSGSNLITGLVKLGTQDYFEAIADMLNDEHFEIVYRANIPGGGENDSTLCKALYEASQSNQKYTIFYRILVEPFTRMKGVNCYDT